jgi:hypothetical protein
MVRFSLHSTLNFQVYTYAFAIVRLIYPFTRIMDWVFVILYIRLLILVHTIEIFLAINTASTIVVLVISAHGSDFWHSGESITKSLLIIPVSYSRKLQRLE